MTSEVEDQRAQPRAKKKARIAPVQETKQASDANEAIRFHFVADSSLLQAESVRHAAGHAPLFTNQIFEEEQIPGYVGLQVDVTLATDTLVPMLDACWRSRSESAADVAAAMKPHFTEGLATTQPEVQAMLDGVQSLDATLAVLGPEALLQPAVRVGDREVELYRTCVATAPAALRALHARLHPLLLFYVDAASALQQDDARMHLVLAVERRDGRAAAVLGFLTYFRFPVFPKYRWRIAQILVLPPFQRHGLGRMLLEAINAAAAADGEVVDVTFEDPAEHLQLLRERVDAERASLLPGVQDAARACVKAAHVALASGRGGGGSGSGGPARPPGGSQNGGRIEVDNSLSAEASLRIVLALQPPPDTARGIAKDLKVPVRQVAAVWDVLLWAAGLRGSMVSQDDMADLLQARIVHRELMDVGKGARGEGGGVPPNKFVLDEEKDDEGDDDDDDEDDEDDDEEDDGEAIELPGVFGPPPVPLPAAIAPTSTPTGSKRQRPPDADPDEDDGEEEEEGARTLSAACKDVAWAASCAVAGSRAKRRGSAAAGPSAAQAGEGGSTDGCEGEGAGKPVEYPVRKFLMLRTDRKLRDADAIASRAAGQAHLMELEELNDECMNSILELVTERTEAVERIAHGMWGPGARR